MVHCNRRAKGLRQLFFALRQTCACPLSQITARRSLSQTSLWRRGQRPSREHHLQYLAIHAV